MVKFYSTFRRYLFFLIKLQQLFIQLLSSKSKFFIPLIYCLLFLYLILYYNGKIVIKQTYYILSMNVYGIINYLFLLFQQYFNCLFSYLGEKQMSQDLNQDALLLLLKCPKKKYIKHLIQYSACLNLCHNNPPKNFKTPIIETFKSDLQLTTQQSHKLLYALSNLVQLSCKIGFNFQQNQIFSQQFDQQLKQVLINTIQSLQAEIQESRLNNMKMGNKLLDFNWKLDLQIANQKGKTNTPNVTIEIESLNNSEMEVDKFQMKGEQFLAFFNNMKKIKENLLQLVEKGQ